MVSREMRRFVLAALEGLNTPRSLSLTILMRYGEWDELVSKQFSPADYLDTPSGVLRYWKDNQSLALFKFLDLPLKQSKAKNAKIAFYEAEKQNCWTNSRFRALIENTPPGELDRAAMLILERGRKKLRHWLGPPPDDLRPKFGPGSVFESRGLSRSPTVGDKLTIRPAVTTAAYISSVLLLKGTTWMESDGLKDRGPLEVKGNRFHTVPKSAKTDRGICIEPGLNVSFQLAIGSLLSHRLALMGLSKREAQWRHVQLARLGSLDRSLATIDLSAASDTMARRFVQYMLPKSWYSLLELFRSPATLVDGKWVFLEKFSSMGNGYTFELQTLLFSALISGLFPDAIPGKDFWVFGDDIIVPTEWYREVVALLNYCGFTINPKKSFSDGCFRESCGGDFFCGVGVRPFSPEEPVSPQGWFSLLNGICRSYGGLIGSPLRAAWILGFAQVPVRLRALRGPTELGDIVLHYVGSSFFWKDGIRWFRAMVPTSSKRVAFSRYSSSVQLAMALEGCDPLWLSLRAAPDGYQIVQVPYS